jgi:hypothetical protein
MGISDGIPAVPRKRKQLRIPFRGKKYKEFLELCSESSAEEKITGILFCGTKIEGTL